MLVNEKITNQDAHLSPILFSCMIVYKVATWYTFYQLVYGLHPLMLTKYVLPTISGDHKDREPAKIIIARTIKLEKLQENKLEAQNNVGINQWSNFLWSQHKHKKKKFQFGNYVLC